MLQPLKLTCPLYYLSPQRLIFSLCPTSHVHLAALSESLCPCVLFVSPSRPQQMHSDHCCLSHIISAACCATFRAHTLCLWFDGLNKILRYVYYFQESTNKKSHFGLCASHTFTSCVVSASRLSILEQSAILRHLLSEVCLLVLNFCCELTKTERSSKYATFYTF